MLTTAADDYWGSFFGLPPTALNATRMHVVAHTGLEGYQGAWIFQRAQVTIVSVPGDIQQQVQRELDSTQFPDLTDHLAWGRAFGQTITKVIGPAYDGFVPSDAPVSSRHSVRRLNVEDWPLIDGLKASCSDDEWDHGGINPESHEPMFGCVVGNRLLGIAQNAGRRPNAVSPGVVTAVDWRRRGVGAAVLAAAIRDAFANDRLVLYQSLMANRASIRLGESLGVGAYAQYCAYRFAVPGGNG